MNKSIQNTDTQKNSYPTSERKCEIDKKRYKITRHFMGDKPLSAIMTEIAIGRVNREMGL